MEKRGAGEVISPRGYHPQLQPKGKWYGNANLSDTARPVGLQHTEAVRQREDEQAHGQSRVHQNTPIREFVFGRVLHG